MHIYASIYLFQLLQRTYFRMSPHIHIGKANIKSSIPYTLPINSDKIYRTYSAEMLLTFLPSECVYNL